MRKAAVVIVSLLGLSTVSYGASLIQADTTRIDSLVVVEEYTSTPTVPAPILQERLPKLEKTIPLPYHKTVHGFVDHFLFRKPSYTRMMLERMPMFFPLYERLLAKYDLPDELKYLSIVESGLNPRAVSHAGAGGLWQFMPGTGRDMRLYQDDYVDERMEPVKATEAACKYLRDLYRIFGDWPLALAAYNSGPGTVKRAMRRSGGDSFWTVYDYLPKETRAYVPQFIAFTYVMNYAADHGITPEAPDYPIPFDTIHVNSYFNVVTFAKQAGIPVSEMQKLNPHITTGILPTYTRDFMLRVPSDQFAYFEKHRKTIIDSASRMPNIMDHILLADAETVDYDALGQAVDKDRFSLTRLSALQPATPAALLASNAPMLNEEPETDDVEEVIVQKPKKATYVVKKGESLFRVAERFDVEVYDLKKWNRLSSNNVSVGQKLQILKDVGETNAEELAEQGSEQAEKKAKVIAAHTHKAIKVRYHRVQQGDTLWNIAQRYDGLTIEQLKKINKIKGNALKPGQKLIVG